VPERMLSLAIGREGQNARLAAKLTGWRIDIRSETGSPLDGGEGAPRPQAVAEAGRDAEAAPVAVASEDAPAVIDDSTPTSAASDTSVEVGG